MPNHDHEFAGHRHNRFGRRHAGGEVLVACPPLGGIANPRPGGFDQDGPQFRASSSGNTPRANAPVPRHGSGLPGQRNPPNAWAVAKRLMSPVACAGYFMYRAHISGSIVLTPPVCHPDDERSQGRGIRRCPSYSLILPGFPI
jgi:hypothetical protein